MPSIALANRLPLHLFHLYLAAAKALASKLLAARAESPSCVILQVNFDTEDRNNRNAQEQDQKHCRKCTHTNAHL